MKFLVDTNILIPLEPTSPAGLEPTTEQAIRFKRLISENAHQIYIHPASLIDLSQDKDNDRRELRSMLLQKYVQLPHPPVISKQIEEITGKTIVTSNDYVDNLMLSALQADAVDWLVSHDIKLHKKAKRIRLSDRTLTILDAIQVIEDLAAKTSSPPPVVESTVAHNLDANDSIFISFRQDYPGFDQWLAQCKREHRQTWLIAGDSKGIAAFCIVNPDSNPQVTLDGKVLKLCSFKVAERFQGLKYGELLLKTVFEYAFKNTFNWIFVTVFEKHGELIELLNDFGFQDTMKRTRLGESILTKPMRQSVVISEQDNILSQHIRYGPRYFNLKANHTFLVPIKPRFARLLFPESAREPDLFHRHHPFGSAIRKAYLCHSSIRTIEPGNVLLFYCSEEYQNIFAIGVVERVEISNSWEKIAQFVAKRTVYSLTDIKKLSEKEVLILLFRQAMVIDFPITKEEAREGGIFSRPPQSIMTVSKEGVEWLQKRLII